MTGIGKDHHAVIFDFDGLMLDTEPVYKLAWQHACSEQGYLLSDERYAPLIGVPTADAEVELAREFGAGFSVERFAEKWPVLWREHIAEKGLERKPGLGEVLDLLAASAIPWGIATSSVREDVSFCLEVTGLAGKAQAIVTVDEVARGKPAPDIYLEAAERLAVDPVACVALEDSNAGARAALSAGMTTIVVPDLVAPEAEVAASVHAVVPSLHEAESLLKRLLRGNG
ncbi:MAG: HAD family phosphatase [Trueperaceae bacterium]|nr:MAG: HAD family phosphatase [Trueperaceae bacterium]